MFETDSLSWMRNNFHSNNELKKTNVIALFEKTYKRIKPFLDNNKFIEKANLFHSHFINSDDQDFRILILFKN